MRTDEKPKASLPELVASIAEREVGVEEKPRGSNRGPRVDQYQKASWLKEKDWGAWCATFICWVVREAMKASKLKFTFNRPQTAAAYDFRRWSLEQDASTSTRVNPGRDIQRGDIGSLTVTSHIVIAVGPPDAKGMVPTVEGNTNDDGSREGYKVCRRQRHYSIFRERIRFTV